MTEQEAIRYIHSFQRFSARPTLERIHRLLALLGNPQDRLRVVLWEGMNCCEKSTPREERCYPFSEEGLAKACSWVRAEIEESRRQMDEEDYD